MGWVRCSQSEGCWKRSLPTGSADFFPLVYGRTTLQSSHISQVRSQLHVVASSMGNIVLFSFCNCPQGRETCMPLMGGYSAPSWHLLLHNGIDSLSLSHTGQQLCQKLVSDHMWQQMLSVSTVGTQARYPQAIRVLWMHWPAKGCRGSFIPGSFQTLGSFGNHLHLCFVNHCVGRERS